MHGASLAMILSISIVTLYGDVLWQFAFYKEQTLRPREVK